MKVRRALRRLFLVNLILILPIWPIWWLWPSKKAGLYAWALAPLRGHKSA